MPTATVLTLDALADRIAAAARTLVPGAEPAVRFEAPRRPEHGDVATNVAFPLAKAARKPPAALAEAIVAALAADADVAATAAELTAVAGFINARLVPAFWQRALAAVLRAGDEWGRGPSRGERISLEFGSANPTGPLAVVQGRTLSIGDTLAKAMRLAGYDVFTEWIINDFGNQIGLFGASIYARYRQLFDPSVPFPDDGYAGDYVAEIAAEIRARDGDRWLHVAPELAETSLGWMGRDLVVAQQQADARAFRVGYDLWQSEKALHDGGAVERGIARLRELGFIDERDGALYIRTTSAGDTEDRVVVRADGRPTYLAGDVAYHYEKLQRAEHVIDILGPDHHGYIARLAALAKAYGREGAVEVLIAQQITLKRGDEIVSMSKRAGTIVTLREVVEEVGVDASRFFFVMLSTDQPLTFDLQLAREQSNENPVYYVQYGHARIASVIRKAAEADPSLVAVDAEASLGRLEHPAEMTLIRRLVEFPDVIAGVAERRAPHRLALYARALASDFHAFYTECRIVGDDRDVTLARLALARATKTVLAHALELCGVSAPERMDRD